jgi:hypothetical protein
LPLAAQQFVEHERDALRCEHALGECIEHLCVGLLARQILGGAGIPALGEAGGAFVVAIAAAFARHLGHTGAAMPAFEQTNQWRRR